MDLIEYFQDPFFVMGVVGLLILLTGFFLLERDKITRHSKFYLSTNIVGSILLGIYAWSLDSIPFLILETVWAIFALYQLVLKQK